MEEVGEGGKFFFFWVFERQFFFVFLTFVLFDLSICFCCWSGFLGAFCERFVYVCSFSLLMRSHLLDAHLDDFLTDEILLEGLRCIVV